MFGVLLRSTELFPGIGVSLVVDNMKECAIFHLPNRDFTFIFPKSTTVFTRKYIYASKKLLFE